MIANQNATQPEPPSDVPPPEAKDSLQTVEELKTELQRLADLIDPCRTIRDADKELNTDDVRIEWNVYAISMDTKSLVSLQGSSTLNRVLSPIRLSESPAIVRREIEDKISIPLIAELQSEMQRRALESGETSSTPDMD